MVREAVVNAARHGGASQVQVDVRTDARRRLAITVSDDGRGFPFVGRLGFEELKARDLGPRTLRARLGELGGELTVNSGPDGARVEMFLPRGASAA